MRLVAPLLRLRPGMVALQFGDLRAQLGDSARAYDTRVEIGEIRAAEDHLRTQRIPQVVGGGSGIRNLQQGFSGGNPCAREFMECGCMPTAFAQWATHDETCFLAHGAFEFHVAHADEHDARFALCLNELDDVMRRLLDAVGEPQADYQYFGNPAPLFHACVCGAQNGEHRDAVDGVDEMLLRFRRDGHFRHEHAFRQRSPGLGNRAGTGECERQCAQRAAMCLNRHASLFRRRVF